MVIRKKDNTEIRYTIYKMYVESTGHYYIGVTRNFQAREKAHRNAIQSLFWLVKLKRKPIPVLSCHLSIAKVLLKGKRLKDISINSRWIMADVSFSIIGTTKNIQKANSIEDYHLQKTKDDYLCLNTAKRSSYNRTQNLKQNICH